MPDWARRDRERDMEWIGENFHIFWPVATEAYVEHGRGAIFVDTTSRPTGEGNPFAYFPQEAVETAGGIARAIDLAGRRALLNLH